MKMQKMPDNNCFVYSCAMVMGIPAQEIFDHIGHDGQSVEWPEMDGCLKYRGIHYQEVLDFAINHGWIFTTIHKVTRQAPNHVAKPFEMVSRLFDYAIDCFDGVYITDRRNTRHAVAWEWSTQMQYDPNGYIIDARPEYRCGDIFIPIVQIRNPI
jgi:hypothetical protein